MGRRVSILLIFLLLVQTVVGSISIVADGDRSNHSPFVTKISLLDLDQEETETLSAGEKGFLKFDWELDNFVPTGEIYTYDIPNQLSIHETQGNILLDDLVVAQYKAYSDQVVEVSFPEDLEFGLEGSGSFLIGVTGVEEDFEQTDQGTNEEITEENLLKDNGGSESDETEALTEDASEENIDEPKKEIEADLSSREPQQITENILDHIKLVFQDGSEYIDGDLIELNEDLRFELDWSLPNDHAYQAGDYFEFQLPKQLNLYNELNGILGDYGSYVVTTDGKVRFTFNEKIEGESNVKGKFWVDTELREETIRTTEEVLEVIVNEEVAQKITVQIKPQDGQAIQKNGQPVGGNFNTDEIKWTIIVNTTRESLENAIVSDQMPEGLELILDSIELKEVEVNLQGHVMKELGEVTDFVNDSTLEELNLKLGDTNKAYKLTFKTKIKEDEKDTEGWKSYYNTAYLHSDGKDKKHSGASVSVERPKSLDKTSSSFNKEERFVEWEVRANFNEKQLSSGDKITDEFTFTVNNEKVDGVFVIESDDIIIKKVDAFDNQGKVVETSDAKDMFDITIEGNKVTYTLKEDTNKAFIIKYKTKAKEGAYIHDNGEISNTVKIDGKTETSSQDVVQQVGVKGNSGIDYEAKTIDWTITINADEQDLRKFVLTDDFSGSGQKLVEGTIKINPEAPGATITPDEDGEGFVINFGDITDKYTITYQTKFTYDFEGEGTPNFENKVNISYETSDGDDYNLEIDDQVDPNQETKSNGVKNGNINHETKEITWTVDINYNQLELDHAKLIDTFTDNQSLVEGSVKIYETTIDKNGGIKEENEVTEAFKEKITISENKVEVDFGEINRSYRVKFKTIDKDGIYNRGEVYKNTAQFFPREGEKHDLKAHVTLPNQGEFLGKSGFHNRDEWTVDWRIVVNQSKSKLTNVTVKDDLGDPSAQILLEDSIQVTKAGSEELLVEGKDYQLTIDGNRLTVQFPDVINDTYHINYSSYILVEQTETISNEAEIESVEEIVGNIDKIERITIRISTGGGSGQGETGGLTIQKEESFTNRPLEGIAFKLVKQVGNQEIVVREGTTDAHGRIEWKGLKFGDYTLIEQVPEGYNGETKQTVTLSSNDPEGIKVLTVENERQTGTAKIVKVDAVTGDKLSGAEFKLTNLTTGKSYHFTTDETGQIEEKVMFGEYTVEEVTAPNGYRVTEDLDQITVAIDQTTEIVVKNEAIVEVTGEKTWIVDLDHELPKSITVELLANGSKIDEKEVTAANHWTYSFTNLDKYDPEGREIDYSIEEVVLAGYELEKDGYNLTNIQTIDISGEKTWVEVDEQYRPDSIIVNLFVNEEEEPLRSVEVSAETGWAFKFTNLPKYDSAGNELKYTVKEVDLAGYTAEIQGFNITNTQETTEITGTKTWLDHDDATNMRPESITVQVLKGDEVVQEQEVSANEAGEWNYTFTDLPKYDKEGHEIQYRVAEKEVPEGYEVSEKDNNLVNLRVGTTEVEVTKVWKDEQETDRPGVIQVNLFQNGEFYEEYEITAKDGWKLTITDLPEFDEQGVAYEYTVKEHDVPGYASEVDGFLITNTRSDTKDIEITKTWLDNESEDRPSSIQVELIRSVVGSAKELVETFTITAEDGWKLEVTDLPAFDEDGKAYTYEIKEEAIDGYTPSIHGFDITNLRTGETSVSVKKVWEGRVAEQVTIKLFADGEEVDSVDLSEVNDWKHEFTDLPKYDEQGILIEYTVDEVPVDQYKKEINGSQEEGFIVTNTFKTYAIGDYTWVDRNKDGIQDENEPVLSGVIVELYDEAGHKIAETETDENGRYIFDELPAGQYKVKFTLTEEQAKKYRFTQEQAGVDTTVDSDANPTTGWTREIVLNDDNEYLTKDYDTQTFYATEGIDPTWDAGVIELVDIPGVKVWVDDENEHELRPESITIELFADGKKVDDQIVTEDWTFVFKGLDKYDTNGEEITYTMQEQTVENYTTDIEETKNGFIITNTLKTYAIGDYTWVDRNKDGIQDENEPVLSGVIVELYDEAGNKIAETETDENGRYIFDELPAGQYKVKFTLTEEQAKKYRFTQEQAGVDTAVDSDANPTTGWTREIVLNDDNEYLTKDYDTQTFNATEGIDPTWDAGVIELVDVSGEKIWEDDNEDNRPESITIELFANGKKVSEVEVTGPEWSFIFVGLDKYDTNGEEILYTIVEVPVAGYESTIKGDAEDGFTVVNTLIPEDPEDPEKPKSPEKEDPKDPEGNELPNTATQNYNLILIGLLMIVVGAVTAFIQRFRRAKD